MTSDPANENMALPPGELIPWLLGRRNEWRALVEEEKSRSVHGEFLLAEGGVLPDAAERLDRLRTTLARAWMRHIARGLEAVWPGCPDDFGAKMDMWIASGDERFDALKLDEGQRLERRGLSGDPIADRRAVDLIAHARFFGEGLGTAMDADGPGPPAMGLAIADGLRSPGVAGVAPDALGAPPDGMPADQALEMASAWGAVQQVVAAVEDVLGPSGRR